MSSVLSDSNDFISDKLPASWSFVSLSVSFFICFADRFKRSQEVVIAAFISVRSSAAFSAVLLTLSVPVSNFFSNPSTSVPVLFKEEDKSSMLSFRLSSYLDCTSDKLFLLSFNNESMSSFPLCIFSEELLISSAFAAKLSLNCFWLATDSFILATTSHV